MSDPPLAECPHCSGELRKLLSAPAFQFKGSGWYVTDYADKGKKPSSAGDSSSEESGKSASGDSTKEAAGSSKASTDAKPAASKSKSSAD